MALLWLKRETGLMNRETWHVWHGHKPHRQSVDSPLLKRQPCYNKGLPRSAHTELLKHLTYLIAVSAKAPGLGCVYPMTLPPSWESLQDCCSTVYTHILVGVETKPLASHANMPVHTQEEHSSSFQRAWRAIHAFPREALRKVPLYFDK